MKLSRDIVFFVIVFFFFEGCSEKDRAPQESTGELDTSIVMNQSLNFHKKLNDSMASWVTHSIRKQKNDSSYINETDTLICVSQKHGRIITGGLWYFFKGSSLILPRYIPSKDKMHPLSFLEIKETKAKKNPH